MSPQGRPKYKQRRILKGMDAELRGIGRPCFLTKSWADFFNQQAILRNR